MAKTKKATNEHTSPPVAKIASKLLRDPKTPAPVKTVAASALTQAASKPKAPAKKKKS